MSACPLCAGASPEAFIARDRNRGVSDEQFTYRRCERCGTLWLDDIPADLGRYYPDQYNPRLTREDLAPLMANESYRLPFVTDHVTPGRLADIGSGSGAFAALASDAGFDVTIVDVDERACSHLSGLLGIDAVHAIDAVEALAGLPASRAITMWHSLEHMPDPWKMVRAAAANLEPGGVLVVAVPNPESFGLRRLGPRWPHLDAPRHLRLFPARALQDAAHAAGLETVMLTADDRGARLLNGMAWHYALRAPRGSGLADKAAVFAGQATALAVAPLERRGMGGAAYTIVLRKPR